MARALKHPRREHPQAPRAAVAVDHAHAPDSPQAPGDGESHVCTGGHPVMQRRAHTPACLDPSGRPSGLRGHRGGERLDDRTVEIVERTTHGYAYQPAGTFQMSGQHAWAREADLIFLLNDDTVCADDCLARLRRQRRSDGLRALMVYDNPPRSTPRPPPAGRGHRRGGGSGAAESYQAGARGLRCLRGAAPYRRSLLEALDGLIMTS